jgi:hypothetical protein
MFACPVDHGGYPRLSGLKTDNRCLEDEYNKAIDQRCSGPLLQLISRACLRDGQSDIATSAVLLGNGMNPS